MKIALIGNEYKQQFPLDGYGGIESCVEQLASGMAQADLDFVVVVPKREKPWWRGVSGYPFEIIEVDFQPSARSHKSTTEYMTLVKEVVAEQKPEIIWSQSHWSVAPLLNLGIPIVCTLHDSCAKQQGWLIDHPLVFYRFISLFQYREWVRGDWECLRSRQIYTGLSEEEFAFCAEPEDYFLWVGGFNWGWGAKGLDLFVDLAKANPAYPFRCYGGGDEAIAKKLRKIARRLPNLKFGGELKRGKTHRRVFQRAKAFLMLTQLPDTMGRTILESLSKGTPVIGTMNGAVPEMVGEAGFCSNELPQLNDALKSAYDRNLCFLRSKQFSVRSEVEKMLQFSEEILNQ